MLASQKKTLEFIIIAESTFERIEKLVDKMNPDRAMLLYPHIRLHRTPEESMLA